MAQLLMSLTLLCKLTSTFSHWISPSAFFDLCPYPYLFTQNSLFLLLCYSHFLHLYVFKLLSTHILSEFSGPHFFPVSKPFILNAAYHLGQTSLSSFCLSTYKRHVYCRREDNETNKSKTQITTSYWVSYNSRIIYNCIYCIYIDLSRQGNPQK